MIDLYSETIPVQAIIFGIITNKKFDMIVMAFIGLNMVRRRSKRRRRMAKEKEEGEEGKKEEEKRRGRRKIKKMRRRDSLFPCVSASWRIPKTLAQAIPGTAQ